MIRPLLLALTLFCLSLSPLAAQENYPVPEDSKPKDGVPKGELHGPFTFDNSRIFPGTTRQYGVYVPAQYTAKKPACLIVVQDGIGKARQWKLPTILDNLIHKREVPVQIAVFVSPGVVPAADGKRQTRFNRSFEYDGMGDRYARFLIEEFLPEVQKKWNISQNPNDRAIAGSRSGAICAFTAAWERPDSFRRVISTVGTYVGLRGGHEYSTMVRKYEPKPIRIFMQDGSNDLNIYGGDWWMANQAMYRSLKWAGYEVANIWGEGGHNGKHAAAIMPDAVRYIWHKYPEPVKAGMADPAQRRSKILIPGEDWQEVSSGHRFTEGPAVNSKGEVFFTDIPNSRIHKVGLDGKVGVFAEKTANANGLMFGPDGKLYACKNGEKKIVRYDENGKEETVLEGSPSNDLVILADGSGYYTDPGNKKLWHFTTDGRTKLVDEGIEFPNGVITSMDQAFLNVSDTRGRFTFSYRIQEDGSLTDKQRYGHLHVPDVTAQSGADGMAVDVEGRTYVTTKVGLQVLDQPGRVHIILRKPSNSWLSNVVFGGPQLDTLYVTCGDKVFKRKVNTKGVNPWQAPPKQPRPRL